MKLSKAEKQILLTIGEAVRKNEKTDMDSLKSKMNTALPGKSVNRTGAFDKLKKKKLLNENNGIYSLTEHGSLIAGQIVRDMLYRNYSDLYRQIGNSKMYGIFCEKLYGKDLRQLNMLPMNQLEKLLHIMRLDGKNRVLDAGCGLGMIAEYIAERTGAQVTGVDVAGGAIKRAVKRNAGKQPGLQFKIADMNDLHFPENSFDAVISLDTLYFAGNLENALRQFLNVIAPGGQMGLFFTHKISDGESVGLLHPDDTPLALVLKKLGIGFICHDFTDEEKDLWRKTKQVCEELKDAFDSEGNHDLCEIRAREAGFMLTFVESGRICRYLYHARI